MKYHVNLPETDFKLRQDFSESEQNLLESCLDDYRQFVHRYLARSQGQIWTLHDGPPYANGHIHIGHAVNKILKDVINRYKATQGFALHYVPGWDCHGLPIEWKVEEDLIESGVKEWTTVEFRQLCRNFATKWLDTQREEFRRLGVMGDWYDNYNTMVFKSESAILNNLLEFVKKGLVYQNKRPVMWSPAEKTSLAEAEVEYKDVNTDSVWVCFTVLHKDETIQYVVWTTTPWTLPANVAVAYNPKLQYVKFKHNDKSYVCVEESLEKISSLLGATDVTFEPYDVSQDEILIHPYEREYCDDGLPAGRGSVLVPADFVKNDTGSGFVHIAPAHGDDDFKLGKALGLEMPCFVKDDGHFEDDIPVVGGMFYAKANKAVIVSLKEKDTLISIEKIRHPYPHSWRSKKPIIYRLTNQWFISLKEINNKVMEEINTTGWYPPESKNRISGMVNNRPDWCISRQRKWGVPMMFYVHNETGEILVNERFNAAILEKVSNEGCDWWFEDGGPMTFLGTFFKNERAGWPKEFNYHPVFDILDVWFDSGSTYSYVIDGKQADLYLEGTDQHRGWFQSSLLVGVGVDDKAPFKNVLTHGFVLDGKGKKMAKSEGNVVAPQDVIQKYGADTLRLWVMSSDYFNDLKCSDKLIATVSETYVKIRNTFRFLAGNLSKEDFNKISYPNDIAAFMSMRDTMVEMPLLEQYMLMKADQLDIDIRIAASKYDFNNVLTLLKDFCINDLSAFYFDIRKDRLYCDALWDKKRQHTLVVFKGLLLKLMKWFTPFIPFCVKELSQIYNVNPYDYLLDPFDDCYNEKFVNDFELFIDVKKMANTILEPLRTAKKIGSSLDVGLTVYAIGDNYNMLREYDELHLVCGVSKVNVEILTETKRSREHISYAVEVKDEDIKSGYKCPRCWQWHSYGPTDAMNEDHLCPRCSYAILPEKPEEPNFVEINNMMKNIEEGK